MEEKIIQFEDFIKVPYPEVTKVKFNISQPDINEFAYDILLAYDNENANDRWITMNAARSSTSVSNNLDKAEYLLAFAQYYRLGIKYYLFGGYYKVERIPEVRDGLGYRLKPLDEFSEYYKRLIIEISQPIGQIYNRWYKNFIGKLVPTIHSIVPTASLGAFPGYSNVLLTHKKMQTIFRQEAPEWKDALSQVKGIYCITDTSNGELYIGSAYNEKGIWGRWKDYADVNNLTGGNKAFEKMKKSGADHIIDNFTYSILEIFDLRTKDDYIINRESYWKKVFDTKTHGMNFN